MTSTDFIAERRSGIGGTDISALVGVNPWKTPLDVWNEKVLGDDISNTSDAMRWGTLLEPVIREEAGRQLGVAVTGPEFFRDGIRIAHIDGMAGDAILECKTARGGDDWGEPGTDEIPAAYLAQVMWYMGITNKHHAHVATLIGASDFRLYHVERNDAVVADLFAVADQFWRNYVDAKTPPEPTSLEDCKRLFKMAKPGLSVSVTEELAQLLRDRKQMKDAMDAMAEGVAETEKRIYLAMRDAESVVDGNGKVIATLKNQTRKNYDVPAHIKAQFESAPTVFRVLRTTKNFEG